MVSKSTARSYARRVRKSPCRGKGPAACRGAAGCKYSVGKKRSFCRKSKNMYRATLKSKSPLGRHHGGRRARGTRRR